jgi:hypothetical protein
MYIFAKFLADHIFLQNLDKINIKKSTLPLCYVVVDDIEWQ